MSAEPTSVHFFRKTIDFHLSPEEGTLTCRANGTERTFYIGRLRSCRIDGQSAYCRSVFPDGKERGWSLHSTHLADAFVREFARTHFSHRAILYHPEATISCLYTAQTRQFTHLFTTEFLGHNDAPVRLWPLLFETQPDKDFYELEEPETWRNLHNDVVMRTESIMKRGVPPTHLALGQEILRMHRDILPRIGRRLRLEDLSPSSLEETDPIVIGALFQGQRYPELVGELNEETFRQCTWEWGEDPEHLYLTAGGIYDDSINHFTERLEVEGEKALSPALYEKITPFVQMLYRLGEELPSDGPEQIAREVLEMKKRLSAQERSTFLAFLSEQWALSPDRGSYECSSLEELAERLKENIRGKVSRRSCFFEKPGRKEEETKKTS